MHSLYGLGSSGSHVRMPVLASGPSRATGWAGTLPDFSYTAQLALHSTPAALPPRVHQYHTLAIP